MKAHFEIPCNGWLVHTIPFILGLIAFILAAAGSTSCRYLSSQNESTGNDFFGVLKYFVSINSPCVNIDFRQFLTKDTETGELALGYKESELDFDIAQVGAIVAMSGGVIVLGILFLSFFRPVPNLCFKYLNGILLICAATGCGMTFKLFNIYWCGEGEIYDNQLGKDRAIRGRCFMEEGSIQVAAALVLYLVTAVVLYFMSSPAVAMVEFTEDHELTPLQQEDENHLQDGNGSQEKNDNYMKADSSEESYV